ncbi:conserved hypothetical protein [Ricinus communis]|uniref:Uncharacterized protein n=1 Tax=Ricinus communis TaxID=3988 RepID=B9S5Y2_RICCO|nr:conserved hypothetical protein [Ricinus communis]
MGGGQKNIWGSRLQHIGAGNDVPSFKRKEPLEIFTEFSLERERERRSYIVCIIKKDFTSGKHFIYVSHTPLKINNAKSTNPLFFVVPTSTHSN